MKNVDRISLTDLYLAYPVLKSRHCPRIFPQLIRDHILNSWEKVRELVNSAVYSVETLLLLGEDKSSSIVQDTIQWIKQQELEDGGWHWLPKQKLQAGVESEVWITSAVYNLLTSVNEANQTYLNRLREYLCHSLEKIPEDVKGWSRLAYVRTALLILKDPEFDFSAKTKAEKYLSKAVEELKIQQLPSGGWIGSEKTKQGGIFQTALVLDTLIQAGLDPNDKSVKRGFTFIVQRMDKLLHAKQGGVLIQALSIFANSLLQLKIID